MDFQWRGHASGLSDAEQLLRRVAKQTGNECFAVHLPSYDVVGRLNVHSGKRVVFQVSDALSQARGKLLRLQGYEVISVLGNDAAKLALNSLQKCDFFIVGHNGADEVRKEIIAWIKGKYPEKPVLALNSLYTEPLADADFNVVLDDQEKWLLAVASYLGEPHGSGEVLNTDRAIRKTENSLFE